MSYKQVVCDCEATIEVGEAKYVCRAGNLANIEAAEITLTIRKEGQYLKMVGRLIIDEHTDFVGTPWLPKEQNNPVTSEADSWRDRPPLF